MRESARLEVRWVEADEGEWRLGQEEKIVRMKMKGVAARVFYGGWIDEMLFHFLLFIFFFLPFLERGIS